MDTDARLDVCHRLIIILMNFEKSQGHFVVFEAFIDFKLSSSQNSETE